MGDSEFEPPGSAGFAAAKALLAPWRVLTDPVVDGYENLPADGRYLLVGNHTTLGVFDVPFVVLGIHDRTGVLVRSLGERQHFRVPLWRDLLSRFGTIDGSRENTRRLMGAGEPVLVFPGGGREVARRRGDYYPLVWRERIGFARLALEFGYRVVPLSMIGVDDMWDVVADADDPIYGPARALAKRIDMDPGPPVPAGPRARTDAAAAPATDLRPPRRRDRCCALRLVVGRR